MKCIVDGCKWEGYEDTKKCWGHSKGETDVAQPTWLPTHYVDDEVLTFAEEMARQAVREEEQ